MIHITLIVISLLARRACAMPTIENSTNSDSTRENAIRSEIIENLKLNGIDMRLIDPSIQADAFLTAPQLIRKYGYPAEVHTVQSFDGYLLEMHRIPNPGKQPVLLLHGILDSSSTWVVMGPNKGFAYMLYELGYDVWMGNVRGNRYSRKHRSLSPSRSAFWQFSFHEIGLNDIPAMIDFVLLKSDHKKLHYVAHSQGSTAFWVMSSMRPEYNKKVLSMQALAPVAYLKHCRSPLVNAMTFFLNTITVITNVLGVDEFMPNSAFLKYASQILCQDGSLTQAICTNLIFLISGYNPHQLNSTMLPVILGHSPAGASTKQMIHFGQLKRSGEFHQYDFGPIENLMKYGTLSPPRYDLSKITAKVALHYASNDLLSEPIDVNYLYRQLPNTMGQFLVPHSNFNHLDFVWGIDARELLYKKIVKIMQEVEGK